MRPLNVLIGCESSGAVRDAFTAAGHNAMSCDLLDSETPGRHYKGDVRDLFGEPFDLFIAHPPCTDLAVSGSRWFAEKRADGRQQRSIEFFLDMVNAPFGCVVVENPVCIMSSLYRKPDQIIQPWQYGHGETKATCLWLKGVDALQANEVVAGREQRVHRMPPGPNRWKERSRTFRGIAIAMATQWGGIFAGDQLVA